jgi:hypothetical protein
MSRPYEVSISLFRVRVSKPPLVCLALTLHSRSREAEQPAGGDSKRYFGTEEIMSFWKTTPGKLRLRLGNLDKFTVARLPVFGTAGLSVTAQTLDPAAVAQE